MQANIDSTVNIKIVKEFTTYADDYHEFAEIVKHLALIGLIYSHQEIDSDRGHKYMAHFKLRAIRQPAKFTDEE
jgi:hypothetical protein